MRNLLCSAPLLLMLAAPAAAAPESETPDLAKTLVDGAKLDAWNLAETVFEGKLVSVQQGPVGLSSPPLRTHRLQFEVQKVYRGELKSGSKLVMSHAVRQEAVPEFPEGQLCLVAAAAERGQPRVLLLEPVNKDNREHARLVCAIPLGWRIGQDQVLSPWAFLRDKAWQPTPKLKAKDAPRCAITGRPALLCGPGASLTVKNVPPPREVKFANPDGDGEYRITVKNETDKTLSIPALLTDGRQVLWAESLVIHCQGKVYAVPGAQGVSGPVHPVELKPGESVSTVINALRLNGPDWPRGGYRISFQFCLGELSQVQSFYYLSRHHDPLRKKLAK